jgi:transcriptional regulator with XRE-family HTH domain
MNQDAPANRLGEYLRARRDLVTPDQAGIPTSPNRRVSGLRREEVAMLAGISGDYYLRLERGRDHNPSPQVLEALSRVLLLDDVETDYLLSLGATKPNKRARRKTIRVPDRLHHLLTSIQVPAFIETRYFDVLAANALAASLSPRLVPGRNRLQDLFLDQEERQFHDDWDKATADSVAAFRGSIGDDISDPRVVEIVGELSLASRRFQQLWARQDVLRLEGGTATVTHPEVGEMQLHRDKLPVGNVLLVLYYPVAGSTAEEKIAILSSLSVQ